MHGEIETQNNQHLTLPTQGERTTTAMDTSSLDVARGTLAIGPIEEASSPSADPSDLAAVAVGETADGISVTIAPPNSTPLALKEAADLAPKAFTPYDANYKQELRTRICANFSRIPKHDQPGDPFIEGQMNLRKELEKIRVTSSPPLLWRTFKDPTPYMVEMRRKLNSFLDDSDRMLKNISNTPETQEQDKLFLRVAAKYKEAAARVNQSLNHCYLNYSHYENYPSEYFFYMSFSKTLEKDGQLLEQAARLARYVNDHPEAENVQDHRLLIDLMVENSQKIDSLRNEARTNRPRARPHFFEENRSPNEICPIMFVYPYDYRSNLNHRVQQALEEQTVLNKSLTMLEESSKSLEAMKDPDFLAHSFQVVASERPWNTDDRFALSDIIHVLSEKNLRPSVNRTKIELSRTIISRALYIL